MNFLHEIFPFVLNMSITASIVIIAVLLLRVLLLKSPKIFSYALWAIVLFRLLCPITIESNFSIMNIFNLTTNEIGVIEHIPQDIVNTPFPTTQIPIVGDIINNNLIYGTTQPIDAPLAVPIAIATALWLLGMVVIAIHSGLKLIKLRKNLVGAISVSKNIFLVDNINSPFVMGLFKPKIYLPSSTLDGEKSFIIAHELCHIKRLDHITRFLAFIAVTIHWFNPLVWLAYSLSEKDMEMSCDKTVMQNLGTDICGEYSKSLLGFSVGKKFISPTPLAFGESNIKNRVKNVLSYKKPTLWIVATLTIICSVIAVFFISNPATNAIINPYVKEYIVGEDNIVGNVDKQSFEDVSPDFAIGADKYGVAVFKEPHKAFKTFTTLYADGISFVEKSENLPPFSKENVKLYKKIGSQLTDGTTEQLAQAIFISKFLDIYENSFTIHPQNSNITTKETKATSVKGLWNNRTEYIGNSVKVGNIIGELSFPDNMIYDNFALKTIEKPYEIIVNFKATGNALANTDENTTAFNIDFNVLETNSKIIFALVGNVEKITYSVKRDGGASITNYYLRENYDEVFNKTQSLSDFRDVLEEILSAEYKPQI